MARYFFAKRNYGTTAQIFVLTVNGWLYSEYLRYGILETYKKKVDYRKFQAEVFTWQGGQLIREVGEVKALKNNYVVIKNTLVTYDSPITKQKNQVETKFTIISDSILCYNETSSRY